MQLELVESRGLVPNFKKTKIMTNSVKEEFKCQGTIQDYVEDFTYPGQLVSFEKRAAKEVQRRTLQG